jgi:hypothetical protein
MSSESTHPRATRRRPGARAVARGLACAIFVAPALAGVAYADPPQEPIRIEYTAPPGCPNTEAFFEEIVERAPRARLVADGAPARTIVVSLTSGKEASFGRLLIRDLDGTESARDMTGDTCQEVVSALALVTALTVDPRASTKPVGTSAPAPASAAASAPASASASAPALVPSLPPSPPPARKQPWHLALTFEASVIDAVATQTLVGAALALEAVAPRGRVLTPTLRLGIEHVESGAIDVGGPSASFKGTLGVAEACPHRWVVGNVALEPCARFEAGSLQGTGSNVAPARDSTRAWLAAGAVGRAEWAFVSPMFLDLEAGVRFPLVRTTFYFEPATVIYTPPSVGTVVSAGLGVRFL